jgi:phenylalanyl-tRNA synthetase beta chain
VNVSHDWLQAHVPHGRAAQEVARLLSAHVATVDAVEPLRGDLAPFVVGRVVESERIPDTKLSFNRVDDGSGQLLEVVCGAPNVTVGAKYPFARTGTTIPGKGGITIEKRKIRGFTSNGMLCSAAELGLGDDHDGILELQTDAAPGTPLLDVLPAGDVRLDVDVLANRPDLLSHLGLARELSALTGVPMRTPQEIADLPRVPAAAQGVREASGGGATVRIEDAEGCPRYCAAVIRGVTVGPSPDWLRERIEAVGGRSINNVVDATNYCLHGLGQPMHAFDLARLGDATIVVRRARDGETLVTLDGAERKLTGESLVIADARDAVALAGVMGGRDSEVTDGTTDVLLEVAYFDPRRVRRGRLLVGLSTDASYRYERGMDRAATLEHLAVGAGVIAAVAGGRVEAVLDVGAPPAAPAPVTLRAARVTRLLGAELPDLEIERQLRGIGFGVMPAAERTWTVVVPSWRHDVTREADLAEEVARLHGYDALPDALGTFRPSSVPDDALYEASARVREALVAAGLLETKPLPFVKGEDGTYVRVGNPLAEDEPHLRRSVLESLARRAEFNLTRMHGDVRLFEIGDVFAPTAGTAGVASGLPDERMHVGVLVMGRRRPPHFTEKEPPPFDLWDAKALAAVAAEAAFPGTAVTLAPVGEGELLWRIEVDGAARGEVRRVPLDLPVWASPAFGVELELGHVRSAPVAAPGTSAWTDGARPHRAASVQYRAIPSTPAAVFDLSLVVPDEVPAARVDALLREVGGSAVERVDLLDEFRGRDVPAGARSLLWHVTLRDPQRTLSSKEVDARRQRLLKALQETLGVRQRAT